MKTSCGRKSYETYLKYKNDFFFNDTSLSAMNMIGSIYQAENITTGPLVSVLNNV